MATITKSGEGSKLSTSSEEYPCVRRLRHRRLLTFLWLQGFEGAHRSMASDTNACFSVPHLRHFVERGQWKGAVEYLLRFLPPDLNSLGFEAQVLRSFLVAHMTLANIIAGTKESVTLADKYCKYKYRDHGSSVCHGIIRLRSIVLTALHAKQQLRESFDWECVWRKASEIVDDLAFRTPELKDMVLKPSGPMKPHNVFPIGFSFLHKRPHNHKKQPRRLQASVLAKAYLQKKRSFFPSTFTQLSHDELLNKAMNCVADAVDESLKAGKRPQLNQEHPLQQSGRKSASVSPISQSMNLASCAEVSGATVAPVLQTMFGTFPSTTKINQLPKMVNAAADKLTRHVLSSGAPFSRMMFSSPVSQTSSGSLIDPAKNSGVSLITNAGATVCPVSLGMFGTMPGPSGNSGIPSVENAGKMTVVPDAQTVLGCLTNPDKSNGISLTTDAESAHQGIITRKNTREELSTDGQGLPAKLQRTTGTFNEVNLAEYMLDADICGWN